MSDTLLSRAALAQKLGVKPYGSKMTQALTAPGFPREVISGRWSAAAVDSWIAARSVRTTPVSTAPAPSTIMAQRAERLAAGLSARG